MTSHDVVARARKALGTRKVGHGGTLDPMATGVLLIGVNRATRLLGQLALENKAYQATIRLGAVTDTDDSEGSVLNVANPEILRLISRDDIDSQVRQLTGRISQVPSSISAIKVDGRRSHARVRAGESVELAPREVTVERFDVSRTVRTATFIDLEVEVRCTTGTYVRALARDLGASLGVGGHLTSLRRTRIGSFGATEAIGIDGISAGVMLTMGEVASRVFKVWKVDETAADHVAHGRRIEWLTEEESLVAIVGPAGELLALAEKSDGRANYRAVFV